LCIKRGNSIYKDEYDLKYGNVDTDVQTYSWLSFVCSDKRSSKDLPPYAFTSCG